jgi:hypothetical protein
MFRDGKLDLQSAAMLKSLDKKEQAEFVKQHKKNINTGTWEVSRFVQRLHDDEVYNFLGKDCEKCKTRTFFSEKSLFPEARIGTDSCLNHGCYVQKWTKLLETRVKSLKREHKSHAAASMIVFDYSVNLRKITGRSVKLDGTDYKIVEHDWSCFSGTGGAGAEPCIHVTVDGAKLCVKPAYRKAEKSRGSNLKDFAAELKLLELPEDVDAAVRGALKAKKIDHWNFTKKVREKVLYGLTAARAGDMARSRGDAGLLLGNAFRHPPAKAKKIFSLFTGKEYAGHPDELLKLGDSAVFAVLYALSLDEYGIPPVYSDEKTSTAFDWSGLPPGEIKKLYQDAIRELLPKPEAGKAAKKAKGKEAEGEK